MANEASIINNPTSTPAAVSTGYQRQNTRFIAQGNGIDHTVIDGGAGGVTVRISGPVDVNGVMYSITSEASLSIATDGRYVVSLEGTGNLLTPTIGTSIGTFDDSKNARYTTGGKRILNWLVYYDGTTAYTVKWLTPVSEHNDILDLDTQPETWITGSGTWTAPRSKYYTIEVQAHGGGGAASAVVGGGGCGEYGSKRLWINAGDVWTAVMPSTSSADTTFSDGATTLTVKNGGQFGQSTAPAGFDFSNGIASGSYNITSPSAGTVGGQGAASKYGSGGLGGTSASPAGKSAVVHGAGGGGAYSGASAQGSGGGGVIRIIG